MKNRFKRYDIVEIKWLDSHSHSGWMIPSEVKKWIKDADKQFIIQSVGYFIQEDAKFLRIAQAHDEQGLNPEGQGDDNLDALFAIAKSAIISIKKK